MARKYWLFGLALLVAIPSISLAQITNFTISDGSVDFSLNGLTGNRTNGSGGSANLRTSTGTVPLDHLFQNWFWYRASGDTREYALSNQVFGTATGNRCRLVYQEPSNDGATANALRVEIEYTIHDLTSVQRPDTAEVVIAFKIQNLTASSLTVQFFNYNDFDLNGGGGGDSAVVAGSANQIQLVTDPGGPISAVYKASGTNHANFQIAPYSSIRDQLVDTGIDNLTNAGSPFGPGDYTGANQWGVSLSAAGGFQDSLVGSIVLEVRTSQNGDLTGDGCVDLSDLALLLANFGSGCP
ncbi:MAG: hypothetical protein KDA32_02230 [Phycisphaerales bacterium]|nr:hypothetical protein [Phycisphaerales bacterium]